MLDPKKAFSSFSVNDIQEAKEFYGKKLGIDVSTAPRRHTGTGTLRRH